MFAGGRSGGQRSLVPRPLNRVGDLAFFVRVLSLVFGSQHSHDHGVESRAVMGTALSECAFVNKPNMLKHITSVLVVLRNVHPCAVEIKLVEYVIQQSKR